MRLLTRMNVRVRVGAEISEWRLLDVDTCDRFRKVRASSVWFRSEIFPREFACLWILSVALHVGQFPAMKMYGLGVVLC